MPGKVWIHALPGNSLTNGSASQSAGSHAEDSTGSGPHYIATAMLLIGSVWTMLTIGFEFTPGRYLAGHS